MAGVGKFCYIRSQMHDKVLTIQDGIMDGGTPVGPVDSSGVDHQLWYEDRVAGVVRSKANDSFVLEIQG